MWVVHGADILLFSLIVNSVDYDASITAGCGHPVGIFDLFFEGYLSEDLPVKASGNFCVFEE